MSLNSSLLGQKQSKNSTLRTAPAALPPLTTTPHSKFTSKVPGWTGGVTVTQTAQHSCHVFLISFKFFFSSSPSFFFFPVLSSFLFLFYDMERLLVRSPPHDFRLWLNTFIENSTEMTWALASTLHQRHPPQARQSWLCAEGGALKLLPLPQNKQKDQP